MILKNKSVIRGCESFPIRNDLQPESDPDGVYVIIVAEYYRRESSNQIRGTANFGNDLVNNVDPSGLRGIYVGGALDKTTGLVRGSFVNE